MSVSNCSICSCALDGSTTEINVHPGDAAVSHIFHRMCIQSWVIFHPGDCPICHRHITVEPSEDPLIRASRRGDIEMVRRYLDQNPHVSLRGRAVVTAARNRHESIVRELLRAPIWDSHRMEAMIAAIKNHDFSILDRLLQNVRSLTLHDWDSLLDVAVFHSLEAVNRILEHGAVSQDCRGRAVRLASTLGDRLIVQRLLRDGTISCDERGLSVIEATRRGYLSVLQELLADFAAISLFHRGEAVWFASINNRADLLQILLVNHTFIRDEDRRRAREAAQNRGFNDIVRILHD